MPRLTASKATIPVSETNPWEFSVCNDGNIDLTDVALDVIDPPSLVACDDTVLAIGSCMDCSVATGPLVGGEFEFNVSAQALSIRTWEYTQTYVDSTSKVVLPHYTCPTFS